MKRLSYSDGDNVTLAIVAIVLAVFALSVGDALVKRFSVDLTLWQIFILRSAVAAPIVVAVIKTGYRSVSLRPRFPGWTALRSLMLAVMWVIYYTALPHLDLSVAAAAYYTLPLFITLFAALFVGEAVGAKGWIAVFIGFCGVSLVLRPQAEDFNAYALLPLVAAVLYALAMILTRTKCKGEHPLILSLSLIAAFPVVGAFASLFIALWGPSSADVETYAFLLGDWSAMGRDEWLVMGLMGTAIIMGSLGAAIAYQAGPASIVASFDFAYVGFAAAWGILFFSETPDALTIAGMALIVGAGVLSAWR